MFIIPALAAIGASFGWATGIVLAQRPAHLLGTFEFTRIQLIACSAILVSICTLLGYWPSVNWGYWVSFASSILFGIILGNLAMIECLRRIGPRRTELLLSFKAPTVAGMAYFWFGETPSLMDMAGASVVLAGIAIAIFFGNNESPDSDKITGNLWIAIALGFAATAFQGFGFLVIKPAMLAGTEPLAASAIRLLGAATVISVIGLWPAAIFRPHSELTPQLLGQTILPGVIGYGVSSTLLLYAFANFDTAIAAVLGSLSPVLVLPILWLKHGQMPQIQAVIGAVLAIAGVSVILIF